MSTPNRSDYISLAEAAAHSPYTQEYLSLRARQGKLRAVKRGRNWVTTLGWLEDYLQQVDDSKTELKATVVAEAAVGHMDKDLTFHPAATVALAEEPAFVELGRENDFEQTPAVSLNTFSWEEEQPVVPATYAQQRAIKNLQQRVDERLAQEPPAISLAANESTDDFFSQSPTQSLDWDRPAHRVPVQQEDDSVGALLLPIIRPMAVAATIVLVISTALIFDGPLKLRQNITAGAGYVLSDIGKQLVAIGLWQDQMSGGKTIASYTVEADVADTTTVAQDVFIPADYMDSEETTLQDELSGKVAGVSTDAENLGFWGTVGLGIRTVFESLAK